MSQMANVDVARCRLVAQVLQRVEIPDAQEECRTPIKLGEELSGNLLLMQVAICHQTQDLSGTVDGKHCHGWDFLTRSLAAHTARNPEVLTPEGWRDLSEEELCAMLGVLNSERSKLRASERVDLVRDLGEVMLSSGWRSASDLYLRAERFLVRADSQGLIDQLAKFKAFSDPVRKKTLFFLGLMQAAGFWAYEDNDNLLPPVDYHEVRGHLRLGTVVIAEDVRQLIRSRQPVSQDVDLQIRQAVSAAICEISKVEQMPEPMTLHYLFWNVFRNVCTRESPACFGGGLSLPARYHGFLQIHETSRCGFSGCCASAGSAEPICEHVFGGHWY